MIGDPVIRCGPIDGQALDLRACAIPQPRVKVLLVSHWFPPSNVVGAVRVGKFAHYLHKSGHDVRVLSADATGDHSLPLEIPADQVSYVESTLPGGIFGPLAARVRRTQQRLAAARSQMGAPPAASMPAGAPVGGWKRHYYALLQIPDHRARWMRAATAAGLNLIKIWRPDLVLGSAPPVSGLIAARRIARACGAPWVAELRDLWSDNPYYEHPSWRWWIDRLLERSVLGDAAGLVTVSPTWAETLRRRYRVPVACVLNGYAEGDYPTSPSERLPGKVVTIVYAGNIYRGYRDPSALFKAMDLLGSTRRSVEIHFYGPPREEIFGLRAAQPVQDRIFVHDRVAYKTSLALQSSADVLLLLQWPDPRDAGNLPAKFFEYLGAGRPILMLGYEHGDLAGMIREREAGLVSNDPVVIAAQLRHWIARRPAGIPRLGPEARRGLARAEQFAILEKFLLELLENGRQPWQVTS